MHSTTEPITQRCPLIHLLVTTCVILAAAITANADWEEYDRLRAYDAQPLDAFGTVATDGTIAVVGAPGADHHGTDAGAIYVFEFMHPSWQTQVKLVPSSIEAGDRFGSSLDVSGDAIIASSIHAGAFVFRCVDSVWVEELDLGSMLPSVPESFGTCCAISGDYALVGAYRAVYIFFFDGTQWSVDTVLEPVDGTDTYFPTSVAIDGEVLVIGDAGVDTLADDAGAAYVYRRNDGQWQQETILTPASPVHDALFGRSVATDGSRVIVGAPGGPNALGYAGAASIFRKNGPYWQLEVELTQPDIGSGSDVGSAVSIEGQFAVVGASDGRGRAAILQHNGTLWTLTATLTPPTSLYGDRYGCSVAQTGGTALIGADHYDWPLLDSGAVFAYGVPPQFDCNQNGVDDSDDLADCDGSPWCSDCNQNGILDECDIALGLELDVNNNAIPDVCESLGDYIGPPGGLWSNPANWSGGLVPDSNVHVQTSVDIVVDQPGLLAATVRVLPGATLAFTGGTLETQTLLIEPGAIVTGGGIATGDVIGHITNCGTLRPAGPFAAGAFYIDGTYEQCETASLDIELAGPPPAIDQLIITGHAALDGVFHLTMLPPFQPEPGDVYDVIQFEAVTGGFALQTDADTGDCRVFTTTTSLDHFSLQITSVPIVPAFHHRLEPTAWTELWSAFGRTASLDEDVAVVGAYAISPFGGVSFRPFVYRFDGQSWLHEDLPLCPDCHPDFWGWRVAVSNDIAAINSGQGTHIYRYDGAAWHHEALLPTPYESAIVISGDCVFVGDSLADTPNGEETGAVYVYRFHNGSWFEEATILASDGETADDFGNALAVDGDILVVGSLSYDAFFESIGGAAYLYQLDNGSWVEQVKLTNPDAVLNDWFGHSVAIESDFVVVGAVESISPGQAGWRVIAHVYHHDGAVWNHQTQLLGQQTEPFDGYEHGDEIRHAVSLSNQTLAIGCWGGGPVSGTGGSVPIYRYLDGEWVEIALVADPLGESAGGFGHIVCLDRDRLLTSAPLVGQFGEAYIYAVPFDCNGNNIDDTCDIADCDGSPWCGDCNANGIPDECDIARARSLDVNLNGIPDECECLADVDGNGSVNSADLLAILAQWGEGAPPEDINRDGLVNIDDLLAVLAAWGPCAL